MPISLGSSNPEERSALSHAQERFTFETVQQAYAAVETGTTVGKVVVEIEN
jgi:hypothetical protein